MQDRAPTKPNRYAVYDDAHNFLRYEYHERADEPTQVGDALNKANLLPDAVATALGLTGNPQVKDALSKVKILIDGNTTLANSKAKIATGSYTPTGAFGASNPSSLTFDFIPKLIWITGYMTADGRIKNIARYTSVIGTETLTSEYVYGKGFGDTDQSYGKASPNGKTISWYSTSSAIDQFNASNYARYFYVAIGWGGNE